MVSVTVMLAEKAEPEYWYFRAEEARVKAELFEFCHTRAAMLQAAEMYERLGDLAAERLAGVSQKERNAGNFRATLPASPSIIPTLQKGRRAE
jgi:hypothetical protein